MSCALGAHIGEDCQCGDSEVRLTPCSELNDDERRLLELRCKLPDNFFSTSCTICEFHKKFYFAGYEKRQRKCCDPYNIHKKVIKKSLMNVPVEWTKNLLTLFREKSIAVAPGQKLCITCKIAFKKDIGLVNGSSSSSCQSLSGCLQFVDDEPSSSLSISLRNNEESPIDLHSQSLSRKPAYTQKIIAKAKKSLKRTFSEALEVEMPSSVEDSSIHSELQWKASCFDEIVTKMKSVLSEEDRTRSEKLQILTLLPGEDNIGCSVAADLMDVSVHMIRSARQEREYGIHALSPTRQGKQTENQMILYENDEFSRQMPKGVPSLRGSRTFHQSVPSTCSRIRAKRVCVDPFFSLQCDLRTPFEHEIRANTWVSATYMNAWYIAMVVDVNHEDSTALLDFMHPRGPSSSFHWPEMQDRIWVPCDHILCRISEPEPRRIDPNRYTLNLKDIENINDAFQTFATKHT